METEWAAALPQLRERVGERNFASWIEPVCCVGEAQGWCLEVPNRFFQEWLTRHFLETIREVLGGADVPVRVVVRPAATTVSRPPSRSEHRRAPVVQTDRARLPAPKIGHLVTEYVFDSFVVGSANAVACHAARAVAEAPGRRFNPFFLWGGVGLGKTHLVNALAHAVLGTRPHPRVAFLAAEAFMNAMISALRQDKMRAFRDRFRDLDLLILDDVQFLAGRERTQEEFFHTFNALHSAGHQIVLTSDKPPQAIAELEQGLKSRFEGGLIVDIHPPTPEMRVAILLKKAARYGVELPDDVADFIAERSGTTVRELEGALTRVIATATMLGEPLNRRTAERVLPAPVVQRALVPVETIQHLVSQHFRVSVADLTSHCRARALAFPRQVAMYLSRQLADASFVSIAERFGGRDHSTVMYAVRTVEEKRMKDPATGALLRTLEGQLRSHTDSSSVALSPS